MSKNSRVLVISDMHIPYHHTDLVPFLRAIKEGFKPDNVICVGDEVDYHAMSFHDSDPDLLSAGPELERSIEYLQPIYKMFPKMQLMESNHGSMVYRKGKAKGIPRHVLKPYSEILRAPKRWRWHMDLVITLSDGRKCMFHHGLGTRCEAVSKNESMNYVQGHYHTRLEANYWANHNDLYWAMTVGCLIDDKSMAFAYNKSTFKRPLIGCAIILDGQPKLLPMILNKKGRWIGKIV